MRPQPIPPAFRKNPLGIPVKQCQSAQPVSAPQGSRSRPRGVRPPIHPRGVVHKLLLPAFLIALTSPITAQQRQNPHGEWRFQSADAWGTRYSPVDQINADNFNDLEVAWVWHADNFGPDVDQQMKSTPTYIDGILYTVAGQRAHRSRHRSRHRRDPLDLSRAEHHPLGTLDAAELREGRRVRRDRRTRRDLLHLARLLPACNRREDRASPGRLRPARPHRRFS